MPTNEPDPDDCTRITPPMHKHHYDPIRTPPRQHQTHDVPMKPGQRRAE